ncbi:MAG: Fe-S cluster assembly sulfur transfer protein SufU [Kiritimatiellia bacterium]
MAFEDLYREVILKHFKKPQNFGPVADEEATAEDENPTCGDHFKLLVVLAAGRISEIRFDGRGCAISTSSCSMMTERVLGKTVAEARAMISEFLGMVQGKCDPADEHLGDLAVLKSVRDFPVRVKCAALCWQALSKALDKLA